MHIQSKIKDLVFDQDPNQPRAPNAIELPKSGCFYESEGEEEEMLLEDMIAAGMQEEAEAAGMGVGVGGFEVVGGGVGVGLGDAGAGAR